jgi:hypothetical protein
VRVRTAKKPLDLHLIAYFTLIEADHVTFIEEEETDVIEEGRIVAQREVELLRRRNYDVPFPDGVLIEAADPDAASLTDYRSKTRTSIGMTPRRSSMSFFQKLLPQWHAVIGSNCGGLECFS